MAKPVTILNLLEETASSHCDESGWDVFRLMGEGLGWILLRGGFEMRRYPRYREELRVETWISSSKRFSAEREYRILSASAESRGELLGSARSLWLFYDTAKRRPASIFGDILSSWAPGGSPACAFGLDEIEGPPAQAQDEGGSGETVASGAGDFAVRSADIDTNGHVNNVVYLGWALEAIPREIRENFVLAGIRGQYKRELRLGDSVKPRMEREEGDSFRLGVFGESPDGDGSQGKGFLAAAASSRWTPLLLRAPGSPNYT